MFHAPIQRLAATRMMTMITFAAWMGMSTFLSNRLPRPARLVGFQVSQDDAQCRAGAWSPPRRSRSPMIWSASIGPPRSMSRSMEAVIVEPGLV